MIKGRLIAKDSGRISTLGRRAVEVRTDVRITPEVNLPVSSGIARGGRRDVDVLAGNREPRFTNIRPRSRHGVGHSSVPEGT